MMMKILSLAFLVSAAHSFSANPPKARPDTSRLVEEAMKITATHGLTSSEAKVAWEIVEEVDASDNSQATKGNMDEECEVEATSDDCLDYGRFLDELNVLRYVRYCTGYGT
jgi:pantoate kinase